MSGSSSRATAFRDVAALPRAIRAKVRSMANIAPPLPASSQRLASLRSHLRHNLVAVLPLSLAPVKNRLADDVQEPPLPTSTASPAARPMTTTAATSTANRYHVAALAVSLCVLVELRHRYEDRQKLTRALEARRLLRRRDEHGGELREEQLDHFTAASAAAAEGSGSPASISAAKGSTARTIPAAALPPIIFVPGYKGSRLKSCRARIRDQDVGWGTVTSIFKGVLHPRRNSQLDTGGEWVDLDAQRRALRRPFSSSRSVADHDEDDRKQHHRDPTMRGNAVAGPGAGAGTLTLATDDFRPTSLVSAYRLFGFFTLHGGHSLMQEYFRRIAVEEDRPYYEFLYDWRRPAVEIADQLESFIDGVARENAHRDGGANKPQVIGHSFGALLLVYYLLKDAGGRSTRSKTAASTQHQRTSEKSDSEAAIPPAAAATTTATGSVLPYAFAKCSKADERQQVRGAFFGRPASAEVLRPLPMTHPGFSPREETADGNNQRDEDGEPGELPCLFQNDRVSSVLLIAPPMRLTPYFLMDILYGDPDYVIDGATHFSFPSVYTFFPDNRYNAEGRWVPKLASNKQGAGGDFGDIRDSAVPFPAPPLTADTADFDGNISSRPAAPGAAFQENVDRRIYEMRAAERRDAGERADKARHLSMALEMSHVFRCDGFSRFLHENRLCVLSFFSALERLQPSSTPFPSLLAALPCLGDGWSFLRPGPVLDGAPFIWGTDAAAGRRRDHDLRYHAELSPGFDTGGSHDLHHGESECGSLFNFHDTETWTRILKVPHRMSEAQAEAHLRNSLTAAHLFWDRIADGTERLAELETEKRGTSGSRTGGHQDDHFAPTRVLPPVSLIVGTGHATGEKLVLLRASTQPDEPEDADPGERFWLCGSPECVPGDGRLPGNRILPRGFENQLLQVYETAANHSQMVNDLDTLGRALSELDEHALLQRQSGSERNTDRTKQHDVYASAHA